MEEIMLSTKDNPYNPFTDFDNWFAFDTQNGYYSCGLLARLTKSSDDISDADESIAIEAAIDEIIRLNPIGLYIKVRKETNDDPKVGIA